jgi:hypothetical protein
VLQGWGVHNACFTVYFSVCRRIQGPCVQESSAYSPSQNPLPPSRVHAKGLLCASFEGGRQVVRNSLSNQVSL